LKRKFYFKTEAMSKGDQENTSSDEEEDEEDNEEALKQDTLDDQKTCFEAYKASLKPKVLHEYEKAYENLSTNFGISKALDSFQNIQLRKQLHHGRFSSYGSNTMYIRYHEVVLNNTRINGESAVSQHVDLAREG
jgi:hypothetical protein